MSILPIVTIGLLLPAMSAAAVAETSRAEDEVRAAFLFNFTKFVEWPPSASPGPRSAFVFAVAGEDSFAEILERLVAGETAKQRPIVVVRVQEPQDARRCQALYISKSERNRLVELLKEVHERPVLTVAEIPGFPDKGGMINFETRENRLRFEINKAAADRAGLSISSQLLGVATAVRMQ